MNDGMALAAADDVPASDSSGSIKALDTASVHRISSGQVVIDLQTAVKELLENSLDAGATSVEVRFKDHGLASVEVIDNGSGIAPQDYDAIALKYHTSKLSSFSDLTVLRTFGFRGEALSSLCALAEQVTVATATASEAPMGTVLELDRSGRVVNRQGKVARQRGTTVTITGLFKPLPVRRKELERNAKREFGKALALLSAYALVPCAQENKGVRLTVTHQPISGKKAVQMRTDGTPSMRASVSALWGPKALEHLVELDLQFDVETERAVLRRQGIFDADGSSSEVRVRGLISRFAVACGRTGTDRQFFYINGRPCNPSKVQKAFNEVYRTFNANQAPFIVADFILPTDSCDVNVSPDKRTILLHSENNLVQALKIALEQKFAPSRATYDINPSIASQAPVKQADSTPLSRRSSQTLQEEEPLFIEDDADDNAGYHSTPPIGRVEEHGGSPAALLGEDESFGKPILLLGQDDDIAGGEAEHGNDAEAVSSGEAADCMPQTADSASHPAECSPHGVTPDAPYSEELTPSGCATSIPPASHGNQGRQGMHAQARLPIATDDASLPVTRLRAVITDSGSPSASQVRPIEDIRNHDEAQGARASSPDENDQGLDSASSARQTNGMTGASGTRSVQTVLSTSGTAWSLHRRSEEDISPPRKKRKTGDGTCSARGARDNLRARLQAFASGSQPTNVNMEEAEDERLQDDEDEVDDMDELDDDSAKVDEKGDVPQNEDGEVDMLHSLEQGEMRGRGVRVDDDQRDVVLLSDPPESEIIDLEDHDHTLASSQDSSDAESDAVTPVLSSISASTADRASRPEVIRSADNEDVSLRFDLSRISSSWDQLQARLSATSCDQTITPVAKIQADAGIMNIEDDEKAVEALSLVIDKTDFMSMEVVGQFNLGFIIARRSAFPPGSRTLDEDGKGCVDDLFIVDQHAADEKYNFETLQQTTKIKSQRLFRPQPLELTAADELLATENIDILRQNGFEIEIDEDSAFGEGRRLNLVAQPTSKSTIFDFKDLEELLHLMQDRPTGQMVRCSKARAMFAMRACRKSVMVGTTLDRRQMTSVIRHMGTMDQPWNCPHGRPTMRHLSDISGAGREWRRRGQESIDWTGFGS